MAVNEGLMHLVCLEEHAIRSDFECRGLDIHIFITVPATKALMAGRARSTRRFGGLIRSQDYIASRSSVGARRPAILQMGKEAMPWLNEFL